MNRDHMPGTTRPVQQSEGADTNHAVPEAASASSPRLRRVPTQPRAQRTFSRLLDATAAILEESGLEAVNTNAVARRAGMTVPTVYRYFPDKEVLLIALAERYRRAEHTWRDGVAGIADTDVPIDALIERIIASYTDAADTYPAVAPLRAAMRTLPGLRPTEEAAVRDAARDLADALCRRDSRLKRDRTLHAATVVVQSICTVVDESRGLEEAARRARRRELTLMVKGYIGNLLSNTS